MLGLCTAGVVAGHRRAGNTQAARQFRSFIGKNVTEHVAGDDTVELIRDAHQQRGHCVDNFFIELDIGIIFRHRAHFAQEQAVGHMQHIGLMYGGDFFAAAARPFEGDFGNAPALFGRDLADSDGNILGRHEFAAAHEHVAVAVETFGALAEDHQVNRLAGETHAHARLGGADIGKQIQLNTQPARGVDTALFFGRILQVVDRAEDDAGRRARRLLDDLGKGGSVFFQRIKTDFALVPFETELELFAGLIEDGEGGFGDFRADAVAGKDKQFHQNSLDALTG